MEMNKLSGRSLHVEESPQHARWSLSSLWPAGACDQEATMQARKQGEETSTPRTAPLPPIALPPSLSERGRASPTVSCVGEGGSAVLFDVRPFNESQTPGHCLGMRGDALILQPP